MGAPQARGVGLRVRVTAVTGALNPGTAPRALAGVANLPRSRMAVMYETVLTVHSLLRWVVLLAALVALARAVSGWTGRRAWTTADERAGKRFTIAFDIQFLIGLILYVALSPWTAAAFRDFGAAMGDSVARFWAVEHLFGMFVALALAHIGRARARRASDGVAKHRTSAIFYGLSLVVMLITIPWPFMAAGRPLLRF